jgi:hypothetical protein
MRIDMKPFHHFVIFLLLSMLIFSITFGQVSPYIVEVKVPPATEQTPLSISVDLAQNTQVQRVTIKYRQFGETEYKELEMLLSGRTAVAAIPAKVIIPPFVEYFIRLQLSDGTEAFFPSENPEVNPLKIAVKGVDPKDVEVRFLSPEPGETLAAEDLAVAISLMFASNIVDKQRTRIYLDGADVSSEAILSDDVVLYSPKNFDKPLNLGAHSIKIELRDTLGRVYYSKRTDFNLSTATAIEEQKTSLQYMGNAQLEYRNENVGGLSTTYTRGDTRLSGSYKFLSFGYDMHLTNEDKNDRQPQNRYLLSLQADEYLKLQVGDAYPLFPSLVVSGKRVRGLTASVTTGYVNVDVSYGKTMRAVEGTEIGGPYTYEDSAKASADNTSKHYISTYWDPVTSKYRPIYQRFNPGEFAQNFIAVRPSFGSGENFQLGFTYMKAKDDVVSIRNGEHPKENLVAGTDLLLAFDNQRVKWTTQVAFSLLNTDIAGGDLTDSAIDSVKGVYSKTGQDSIQAVKDAKDLKDLAKLGRKFITINENLSPLDPMSGFPSLSFESELTVNYFNNFVRAMAFRRGANFKSFGNEYVQTDIAGINLSDRVRLFDNKIMTSVSYETKWNNIQNTSRPRTTYNTFNGSVTAYPGAKWPTISVGYGFNTRNTPIDMNRRLLISQSVDSTVGSVTYSHTDTTVLPSKGDSTTFADEITNRIYVALNYDFYMLSRQSLNAMVSITNKTDNTFNRRDQDNLNVTMSLTTFYKIPLQTTVALILSHNVTYSAYDPLTQMLSNTIFEKPNNYQTVSLSARYRMLNDRLNLLAGFAPSFGDFKRTLVQAGADYQVMENHFIVGQLDLIQNPGKSGDLVFGIIYRFSF